MEHEFVSMKTKIGRVGITYSWGSTNIYESVCLCGWTSNWVHSFRKAMMLFERHLPNE